MCHSVTYVNPSPFRAPVLKMEMEAPSRSIFWGLVVKPGKRYLTETAALHLKLYFVKLKLHLVSVTLQCCRRLPNLGRSPEFGSFQKIAEKIAQNFCAIFIIGPKRPKKLPDATKMFKKLLEFLNIFFEMHLKKVLQKLATKKKLYW